jgi:hypothetical protein
MPIGLVLLALIGILSPRWDSLLVPLLSLIGGLGSAFLAICYSILALWNRRSYAAVIALILGLIAVPVCLLLSWLGSYIRFDGQHFILVAPNHLTCNSKFKKLPIGLRLVKSVLGGDILSVIHPIETHCNYALARSLQSCRTWFFARTTNVENGFAFEIMQWDTMFAARRAPTNS